VPRDQGRGGPFRSVTAGDLRRRRKAASHSGPNSTALPNLAHYPTSPLSSVQCATFRAGTNSLDGALNTHCKLLFFVLKYSQSRHCV